MFLWALFGWHDKRCKIYKFVGYNLQRLSYDINMIYKISSQKYVIYKYDIIYKELVSYNM